MTLKQKSNPILRHAAALLYCIEKLVTASTFFCPEMFLLVYEKLALAGDQLPIPNIGGIVYVQLVHLFTVAISSM